MSNDKADDDKVKVVVRVRPLNSAENQAGYPSVVTVDQINGSIKIEHLNQVKYDSYKYLECILIIYFFSGS